MIFYFSGCGNSRWAAEQIAEGLGDELYFIPDCQTKIASGELPCDIDVDQKSLGFVFPIYSWAAPQLVEDFIRSVKWEGKPSHVWFACTCGDEMGMAYNAFGKTLEDVQITLDAGYCFQMPETYLCFPGFKLDTEEGARKKIAAAAAKMPSVIESIRARRSVQDVIVGSMPRLKTYLIRPGFVKNVSDAKYFSMDSCVGCGKCVEVCPLHNVKLVDGRPQWQGHCTQCMACYQYCPKNAIQCATYTKGKGQYHFRKSFLPDPEK